MNAPSPRVSRPAVGAIAAGLILAGSVLSFLPQGVIDASQEELFRGACFRVGLVMVALWLALPLLERNQAGYKEFGAFLLLGLLALLLLRRIPLRIIVPAAVILGVVGLLLRPRPKRRPGDRP